jgi:plastocyanin
MKRPTTRTAVAALLAVSLASLGMMRADPKQDKVEITIEDTQFKPDEVTIKKGQTVRWTNKDNRDHIIMAKDQSFKSENLRPGEKFEHKFTEVGTFDYICVYRPRMLGQVKVEE